MLDECLPARIRELSATSLRVETFALGFVGSMKRIPWLLCDVAHFISLASIFRMKNTLARMLHQMNEPSLDFYIHKDVLSRKDTRLSNSIEDNTTLRSLG